MPGSDNLVIVLDPGHGGENEGLTHRGLVEKDMNLVTAGAMRDELLQYDNVEVYITNPNKEDMSLKERAEYADSVGADILISLHFNMSENHEMYGSEVWVPSAGLNHARMHSLGDVFMEQFDEMGFTLRGVKTRLNDGGLDYYGILRESTALGVPSILVEHGYADHARDYEKVNDKADWETLGRSDATAVAKFFGLKSSSLGRDYSTYVQNGYFTPETVVGSDTTGPEDALLVYLGSTDQGDLYHISAWDGESEVVYYDYSIDGGATWSEIFPFENGKNSAEICISDISAGAKVMARVYNGHFVNSQSSTVFYEEEVRTQILYEQETAMSGTGAEGVTGRVRREPVGGLYVCLFMTVAAILLLLTAFATYKERQKIKRMSREERRAGFLPLRRMRQIENACLLTGVCLMLAGITLAGISFAKSHFPKEEEVASIKAPTETPKESAQPVEIILPPELHPEKNEGYIQDESGKWQPGEELLAKMRYNEEKMAEPEMVTVYDIAEGYMRVPLVEGAKRCSYDMSGFSGTDLSMNYAAGDGIKVMKGIDVSKFQGNIDWQQVKEAGVEFAMLRLGIRGYGSGELVTDDRFYENYRGATEAGIKVGVYFFSAAISREEAQEEADYVMERLLDCPIEMPVVFDTEPIFNDDARTDDLTPDQLTEITTTFCERIAAGGYRPMIYANAKRFTTVLHLEQLEAYDKWLADYRNAPDYPYEFKMWQFTEKGTVPGISGNVDIDLYFYKE